MLTAEVLCFRLFVLVLAVFMICKTCLVSLGEAAAGTKEDTFVIIAEATHLE